MMDLILLVSTVNFAKNIEKPFFAWYQSRRLVWFFEGDTIVKKVLVVFAGISASVFGINVLDTSLTSSNSSKNINLQNIKNYNDYYIANYSDDKKWGEFTSEEDQFLEELYEVYLHLKKQEEEKQKYQHWIKAIESKDINLLKKYVINSKDYEIPLLILMQYGPEKLSVEDLFALTQALLSDNKIKKKIKLNNKNKEGDTPLLFIAKNNNEKIFKLLVNNGANANESLHILMKNKQTDLVKWLISQKALKKIKLDVNTENNDGDTPLLIAAQNEDEEMFDLLVQNGANIKAKSKDGRTAREIAVSKGFKNYIEKQSDKKNEKNSKNENNLIDATLIVAKDGEGYKKQRLVLEKKLWKRIKKGKKIDRSLIFDAIGIDSQKIVKHLIEKCEADVNEEGWAGSPLHCATALSHEDIVKYLIERGADINKGNKQKDTALHIATEMGNQKLIKLLVENGANVNAENDEGKTPLMIASSRGNENIVKYLIEHDADINYENRRKESALLFASIYGYEDLVESIIDHGGKR